jgi:hypothetical protein
MGKSKAPAPPDYAGAAAATAAGNLDAARATATANRIDQYTPYGNLLYTNGVDGNVDHWRSDTILSPTEQAKLDKNNTLDLGLLDTANKGLGQVNDLLSNTALNESKLAQPSIQGQAVQDAVMSRLAPQFAKEEDALRTRLANQGIMQNSEAFNGEMGGFNNRRNDAYVQAALQGINTGQQARAQGIQEQYSSQDRPLNVINALRTGAQMNLPQFNAPGSQANVGGPDLLGAANAQYNAQLGATNAKNAAKGNFMGGLFGLGSSAISGGLLG